MSSKFELCLLLYVIRLAGWLKHCNLSVSQQLQLEIVIRLEGIVISVFKVEAREGLTLMPEKA